jgi:hypothetical protein
MQSIIGWLTARPARSLFVRLLHGTVILSLAITNFATARMAGATAAEVPVATGTPPGATATATATETTTIEPSPSASATVTETATETPTDGLITSTATASEVISPTESVTPSETATASEVIPPTESATPSETVTASEVYSPTESATPSETATATPTASPTTSASPSATLTATATLTTQTATPTSSATVTVTATPTPVSTVEAELTITGTPTVTGTPQIGITDLIPPGMTLLTAVTNPSDGSQSVELPNSGAAASFMDGRVLVIAEADTFGQGVRLIMHPHPVLSVTQQVISDSLGIRTVPVNADDAPLGFDIENFGLDNGQPIQLFNKPVRLAFDLRELNDAGAKRNWYIAYRDPLDATI